MESPSSSFCFVFLFFFSSSSSLFCYQKLENNHPIKKKNKDSRLNLVSNNFRADHFSTQIHELVSDISYRNKLVTLYKYVKINLILFFIRD